MPNEVIDALAGLNVERAIFLALALFGSSAAVLLLALSEGPLLPEHWVPERVRKSAAYELAALRWFQFRDRARLALVAALLICVARLDSSSPISRKGDVR
ncbi:hypothetical protein [Streptomyces sp. NPDC057257]|uniref:hypothetical protein n=1 Tax=Streptomyces sp. NPDC057257 TaxID=3346071 RepID=UPI0036318562